MKNLNNEKPIVFLGDIHGAWYDILFLIDSKHLENCNLICVGDIGIGFEYKKEIEYDKCKKLNKKFKDKNINFYGIRGNHDNPFFFKGDDRVCLSNFELIEDYTIFEYDSKKIQFIGGAISIDRTHRREGISYWSNEGVVWNKEKCQKVDILVTHTSPSHCFPQKFNQIVYDWARDDAYLIEDLTDERAVVDEIFKICDPSFHVYGHFHSSRREIINNCNHVLLDINEFYEYR
jgi:predicted phosphodiesterase